MWVATSPKARSLARKLIRARHSRAITYATGALAPDGTPAPQRDPFGSRYILTARPGHRVPLAWIGVDGRKVSSLDLIDPGKFVLFVNGVSEGWRAAARNVDMSIEVIEITEDGEFADPNNMFLDVCGIGPGGATFARPVQHIASHVAVRPANPRARLAEAFDWLRNSAVDLEEQRRVFRPALDYRNELSSVPFLE